MRKNIACPKVPTILPPLSEEEAIQVTQIYSVAGLLGDGIITERPFRAPHNTASSVAIIGGGCRFPYFLRLNPYFLRLNPYFLRLDPYFLRLSCFMVG